MRSLREIGDFVGVSQDSLEYGSPSAIGLRYIVDVMAHGGPDAGGSSMRQIDAFLGGLQPVTLEASLTSFVERRATVRVSPTTGLVIGTHIFARNAAGAITWDHERDYGSAGGDYQIQSDLSPGAWSVIARRTGVGPTGYVAMEQAFPVVSPPERQEPRPQPADQTPPHIEVRLIRDPDDEWAVSFHVTGTGFEANQVSRREGEGIFVQGVLRHDPQVRQPFWTSSDAQGRIDHTTGAVDVRGIPRDAANRATLVFTACDRRTVPPRNDPLWSNAVDIEL